MSEYDWDNPDPEVERKWAEEIRRRVGEYRAGVAETKPIEQVLDDVDRLLDERENALADGQQNG